MQALDRRHRVRVVPFQQPGAAAAYGLSVAQCRSAVWGIAPGWQRAAGAAAINLVVAVALGTRLPLWIYTIPGIQQLQDSAYAWVARNRQRLPGVTPYCEQYPDQCGGAR